MKWVVGTRGSRLALAQTRSIVYEMSKLHPSDTFEIKTVVTKGDRDTRPLFAVNQKGIFEKELDEAVLDGAVDFAVHSLKDVPSTLAQGLVIGGVPKRLAANDVLISRYANIQSIPRGAVVATSSLRRAAQLRSQRDDIKVTPVRGNIDTRVKRLDSSEYDAMILAEAGLTRLDFYGKHTAFDKGDGQLLFCTLPLDVFMPSPGQGALALVCQSRDRSALEMTGSVDDVDSRLATEAERALSNTVDSGCRFPVGAYGVVITAAGAAKKDETDVNDDDDVSAKRKHGRIVVTDRADNISADKSDCGHVDDLILHASAFSLDGKRSLYVKKQGPKSNAMEIGMQAGKQLVDDGIAELARDWRRTIDEWNK